MSFSGGGMIVGVAFLVITWNFKNEKLFFWKAAHWRDEEGKGSIRCEKYRLV